jgi:hypothetical protein
MAKSAAIKNVVSKSPAKKSPLKTTSKKVIAGKDKPIKYEDKSPGQLELIPIFNQLKKLIASYSRGTLVVRGDKPNQYHLWSDKEIELKGRKMPDVYFSGLMVQKGFVGFYFMPVYVNPGLKSELHPQLLKCLKGKSCFHIKKNDPELMKQVTQALEIGYEDYKRKGWV